MPYNPGIRYRGDQYLAAGINDAADSISKYFRNKRAEQDELEMQRGVLLGRYGENGQFGGSERLGEPSGQAGQAGQPGYGGEPIDQQDQGVAEQLGESAGAAGEPGASGGGIFGMFGRSNQPTAPAKTKATDSQTAESKGFKGLQAFASSEYNIPTEATTSMSKNALKGFLMGLEQRRTAEGQDQDRKLRQRQFVDQQELTSAQVNHYAAMNQDRAALQKGREAELLRAKQLNEALKPTSSIPGPTWDINTLAAGQPIDFVGQPAVVKQPDREQVFRALLQYGTPAQQSEAASLLAKSDDPVGQMNADANFLNATANFNNATRLGLPPTEKPTVRVKEVVNGTEVTKTLTESQFAEWQVKNPGKATAGLQDHLAKLRAARAAGKRLIDLDQLIGGRGIDLSPLWGGKPIEDGIRYLESLLGGGAAVSTQAQFDALPKGTIYTGKDGKQYRKP